MIIPAFVRRPNNPLTAYKPILDHANYGSQRDPIAQTQPIHWIGLLKLVHLLPAARPETSPHPCSRRRLLAPDSGILYLVIRSDSRECREARVAPCPGPSAVVRALRSPGSGHAVGFQCRS